MNKYKGENGKLLLTVECQYITVEGMKDLENYQLAITIVITVSDKNHKC